MRILQWNLNGLFNNYAALNLLINKFSPHIIGLQETHLPANKSAYTPNNYVGYFYNLPRNKTAKQGIDIFIKKSVKHKQIPISSNIATLAVEIDIGFKFSVITCYIPPHPNFNSREVIKIADSFSTPSTILGDFNAWSSLWGSSSIKRRGQELEDTTLAKSLVVLNDGQPTHFSTHNSFTHVDIVLSTASIAHKLSSLILKDFHNSDNFPIVTTLSTPSLHTIKPRAKFLTEKADWAKYCSLISSFILEKAISSNINAEASTIKSVILSAAHLAIPQTNTKQFSTKLPYWSKMLSVLRNRKQTLWATYKHNRTINNLIQ
uniref:Putative RNA-directed DNA polymerase from transposon X-element n=1 Tax=Bactrocera latifrons TaxID=174628 RepID=A0A0K8VN14_BACLA